MSATPTPIGLIGHSHALRLLRAHAGTGRCDLELLQLGSAPCAPNFLARRAGQPLQPTPALVAAVQAFCAGRKLLVCAIHGSAHALLGLVEHPRPWDFVPLAHADQTLDPRRERVPEAFVRSQLMPQLRTVDALLQQVVSHVPCPVLCPGAPPPMASERYLRAHAGSFADLIRQHGVTPAPVRMKIWRLYQEMERAMTAALPLVRLAPPPEALDAEGFLAEDLCDRDPVHGNGRYGMAVLRQLDAWQAAQALTS